jgi:hypothetical protein
VTEELEIAPGGWLEVFERDYLASFISQGGAAIKVLVGAPEVGDRARFAPSRCGRAKRLPHGSY